MAEDDEAATNLSGVWFGEYWYGGGANRTSFAAHLLETAGALTGTTLELVAFLAAGELSAVLTGSRDASDVSFTKVYDEASRLNAEPVAYQGVVDAGLQMIGGHWRLLGISSLTGGFLMRRVSSSRRAVKRELAEALSATRQT